MSSESAMDAWREGLPVKPPRPPKPIPTCSRRQYRRLEREDHENPELMATVTVAVVPDDVYEGMAPELVPLARVYVERFQHPVTELPLCLSTDSRRSILAAVYHMRHHNRMRLHLDGERPAESLPGYDLVDSINRLCRLYKEEMLAAAGHRTMAHGVFPIDPRNPSKGWRVQIWDTSKEKRNSIGEVVIGGKLHIAYKPTEEKAWDTLAEWFLKHRGLDVRKYVCHAPGSGIAMLAGLMRRAASGSNDYVEVSVKELYGSDEEWD